MISTIICTYNREKYIGRVLQALADQEFDDYEIVVVDNNSTDATAQIAAGFKKMHPDLKITLCNESRQGLSHARNCGIQQAKGDFLVFLDDDAIPCRDYLARLGEGLKTHPGYAGFGGRIEPVFEDGIRPKWLCRWTLSWASGLDMGTEPKAFRKGRFPIGANMGFKRETVDKVGGFDTGLGRSGKNLMGGEEKDFFLRVQKAGYKIIYLPQVTVKHVIPQSRTTTGYIRRFARGVGLSERLRSKNEGRYPARLFSEAVKWGGTLVLSVCYFFTFRPACARALILFRFHASKSLLRGK